VKSAEYRPTGKVEVSWCLGTNVPSSKVKRQRTCDGLKAKLTKADDKAAGKMFVEFDCIR